MTALDDRSKVGGLCYYCGAPATSREHAPPRLLFHSASCDSITVPSCALHNTSKTGDDQAILVALALGLRECGNEASLPEPLRGTVDRIVAAESLVRRKARLIPVQNGEIPIRVRVPYLSPAARFKDWTRQLTSALVCDGVGGFTPGIDWRGAIVESEHWIDSPTGAAPDLIALAQEVLRKKGALAKADELDWIPGWSASPRPYPRELYRFQILREGSTLVVRHQFLGGYLIYVVFDPPETVLQSVLRKTVGSG